MKSTFILIALLLFTSFGLAQEERHLISVNGVAEKAIDPNMAVLHIEVLGRGQSAKAAQEIQIKFYQKVKEAVEKFKIKKEDFKTENLSIQPEYAYDPKTQSNKMTGYRVSHNISLILRDKIDQTGALVDSLAASGRADTGGVHVQSISWDYDKKAQVEKTALAEAVAGAREKAEELAKAAGVKIKAVHRMEFMSSTPMVPMQSRGKMMMMEAASTAPTEVSSGQVKVVVNVYMQFEI